MLLVSPSVGQLVLHPVALGPAGDRGDFRSVRELASGSATGVAVAAIAALSHGLAHGLLVGRLPGEPPGLRCFVEVAD